jgi:hypothetical protein
VSRRDRASGKAAQSHLNKKRASGRQTEGSDKAFISLANSLFCYISLEKAAK